MVLDHTRAVYTSEDEQGFTFRQIMNQYLAVDDYRDAIVFLYQAYKMRPLAIYQEELGHNYHMIGIDQIRYRENSSAYELDRSSLMKAKRCFELVIHDTDENMRVSMIRSCGHDLLKILHILHFDFEFDRYYTDFSGYLEADRTKIQANYFYACVGFAAELCVCKSASGIEGVYGGADMNMMCEWKFHLAIK